MSDLRGRAAALLLKACCICPDEPRPPVVSLIQDYVDGRLWKDNQLQRHLSNCLRYARARAAGPKGDPRYYYEQAAEILEGIQAEVSSVRNSRARTHQESLVEGNTVFALELYQLLSSRSDATMLFSPASVHFTLSLLLAGASGSTAHQITRTLHRSLPLRDFHAANGSVLRALGDELNIASALWIEDYCDCQNEFEMAAQQIYLAKIAALDFGLAENARRMINDWVATETRRKITEVVPHGMLDDLAGMVVTNAVYFKGDWAKKFETSRSTLCRFYVSSGESVETWFMHQNADLRYMEDDRIQVLEMAYEISDLSMLIMLPKRLDGLQALEKTLETDYVTHCTARLQPHDVRVTLPRWNCASQFELSEILKQLGIVDAFEPELADFPAISTAEPVYLSSIAHKAFVAADEQGTEAAAVTASSLRRARRPQSPEPKVFRADHPFLFLIRHRPSNLILFMGRIVDPRCSGGTISGKEQRA